MSLPSSYRSRRGHIHLPRVLPLVGCRSKTPTEIPKHESLEREHKSREGLGDKESPKVYTHLKGCEPLYTCPRAPFYRETKGLLHSENTLESKEYS
jgi:hypothetical protein